MIHLDATVHPQLSPLMPRLEFVGNSSYRGVTVQVNGANLAPWHDRSTGRIDWATLSKVLDAMPPGLIVSPNLESPHYPTARYGGMKPVDVSAIIGFHAEFARIARSFGLIVASPFEALQEAAYPAIDSERYTKAGAYTHSQNGQDKLVSVNNDALQPIFDLSDVILARCYVTTAFSPAQVRTITKRTVGEAYRVGRGKPIIAATRPDTLTDGDMAAQLAECEAQKIHGLAYWLDMHADPAPMHRMMELATMDATREE